MNNAMNSLSTNFRRVGVVLLALPASVTVVVGGSMNEDEEQDEDSDEEEAECVDEGEQEGDDEIERAEHGEDNSEGEGDFHDADELEGESPANEEATHDDDRDEDGVDIPEDIEANDEHRSGEHGGEHRLSASACSAIAFCCTSTPAWSVAMSHTCGSDSGYSSKHRLQTALTSSLPEHLCSSAPARAAIRIASARSALADGWLLEFRWENILAGIAFRPDISTVLVCEIFTQHYSNHGCAVRGIGIKIIQVVMMFHDDVLLQCHI
jgi:hypothetical protein